MNENYTLFYVAMDSAGANYAVDRGFSAGTMFARKMEDAIGRFKDTAEKYVCAVVFPNVQEEIAWQFRKFEVRVPADRIYWCKKVVFSTVHKMSDSDRAYYFKGNTAELE